MPRRCLNTPVTQKLGPKSLNKGLREARGEYIARMDADDISEKDRFTKQVEYLRNNPKVDLCSTAFSLINENGVVIKKNANGRFNDISYLFRQNPIGHSTVMFKTSLLKMRNPLYNELFRCEQDYELWTYLLKSGVEMEILPDVLVKYRISRQQISNNKQVDGEYSKKTVRRNFINDYLIKNHIINSSCIGDPIKILNAIESTRCDTSLNSSFIYNILFVMYYTIINAQRYYFFKYIRSPHLLVFKFPWQDTFHLLMCSLGKGKSSLLY